MARGVAEGGGGFGAGLGENVALALEDEVVELAQELLRFGAAAPLEHLADGHVAGSREMEDVAPGAVVLLEEDGFVFGSSGLDDGVGDVVLE